MPVIRKEKNGIRGRMKNYIEIWANIYIDSETYYQKMEDYVKYWKDVANESDFFPPMPNSLQLGFWPSTSYTTSNPSMFDYVQHETTLKDGSIYSFCGVVGDRPKGSYNLYRSALLGDFVLVHPPDVNVYPRWMGRAFVVVQLDRNHSKFKFDIGGQANGRKKKYDRECNKGAWNCKWECDPSSTVVM